MDSKPSFYIEVVRGTHLGTDTARISWHGPHGFNGTLEQRLAMIGRYACHRMPEVGVHIPLIEPQVEISVAAADKILRGIETGYIDNEAVIALRKALAAAMRITT